jgi:hypothetical protein
VAASDGAPLAMTGSPGLLERAWGVLSRWAVPVMMTLAYALLVATSEASRTGEAWMAAGLILVMTAWVIFRRLTAGAALSRALSVGDTAALFAIADRELARRRRRPAVRTRYFVARGFAQLLRGEHAAALATMALAAGSPTSLHLLIDTLVRIELDHEPALWLAGAGDLHDPRAPWLGWLLHGAVACHRGNLDASSEPLTRVVNDIRAGSALRAIAHLYLARITDARGDTTAATEHRASAAALAAADAAWLRGDVAPIKRAAP